MASGRGLPDARLRAAAVAGVDPHAAVDLYDCVFPDARDPRWTVGRDRDPPRVSGSQSELDEEVPSHRPAVEAIRGLPGRRAAWRSRSVVPAAGARYARSSMLDVIRADYVRTAKAKGLRELAIVVRHAAKNALIPVVTIAGVYLAFVVTGSFYVESVTGVPGLGRYLVLSISARDYPVIMGTTLLLAIIVMVVNLIVDLSYALLDPRIRYE